MAGSENRRPPATSVRTDGALTFGNGLDFSYVLSKEWLDDEKYYKLYFQYPARRSRTYSAQKPF